MKVSRRYLIVKSGAGANTRYGLLRRVWGGFWWRWEPTGPGYPSLDLLQQEIGVQHIVLMAVRGTVNDMD